MIENRIKILSEYLSKQKNATWNEKKAFNDVVEHCLHMQDHYRDKTLYLERMCSWYVDHIIELNQDHIGDLSYDFLILNVLGRLKNILEVPSKYNYLSVENNVLGLDIRNGNKIKPYGSVSEAVKLLVMDVVKYNTRDKNGRT